MRLARLPTLPPRDTQTSAVRDNALPRRALWIALLSWATGAVILWAGVTIYLSSAERAERQHVVAEADATAGGLEQALLRSFDMVSSQFDLLANREAML